MFNYTYNYLFAYVLAFIGLNEVPVVTTFTTAQQQLEPLKCM